MYNNNNNNNCTNKKKEQYVEPSNNNLIEKIFSAQHKACPLRISITYSFVNSQSAVVIT